jgi:hypothetical protein
MGMNTQVHHIQQANRMKQMRETTIKVKVLRVVALLPHIKP